MKPHSILNEIGRFDVKESKFKREMEKLRTHHQKDLYLEGVFISILIVFIIMLLRYR